MRVEQSTISLSGIQPNVFLSLCFCSGQLIFRKPYRIGPDNGHQLVGFLLSEGFFLACEQAIVICETVFSQFLSGHIAYFGAAHYQVVHADFRFKHN